MTAYDDMGATPIIRLTNLMAMSKFDRHWAPLQAGEVLDDVVTLMLELNDRVHSLETEAP